MDSRSTAPLDEARNVLGLDHLTLMIHDVSFPSEPDADVGRGTPYGKGAQRFLRFARQLGFNSVGLGPQGRTSAINPSPYDGALFAREPSNLALDSEVLSGLLTEETRARLVAARPSGARADALYAKAATRAALEEIADRQRSGRFESTTLSSAMADRENRWRYWLEADHLYLALAQEHATDDWRRWPTRDRELLWPSRENATEAQSRRESLLRGYDDLVFRNTLTQTVLDEQHRAFREFLSQEGLLLFGDLQIGISFQDTWAFHGLFLDGYRMGAPPSRTNLDGQPWGYPLLDPALYQTQSSSGGSEGPALRFVRERIRRLLVDFDGIRLDHPHGWVCPWAYRSDDALPGEAVRTGARLFASPDLADHPRLAKYALVEPSQLDRSQARYADGWERSLTAEQVERYGTLLSALMEEAEFAGRSKKRIMGEVLSTWPRPLREVMTRHGLGRFLVTQKTQPENSDDVYRSETARPEDWAMVGTHDTESIWALVPKWRESGFAVARAKHLADLLEPEPSKRTRFAEGLVKSTGAMVDALFAEILACKANNVSVFFPDLLGITERYNAPGTVGPENWSLRVPTDFAERHAKDEAAGMALSLRRAFALALRARGAAPELQRALATP